MDIGTYSRISDGLEDRNLDGKFKVSPEKLVEIVEWYRSRTYNEDVDILIQEIGGSEKLAEKLCSDPKNGICIDDFEERDAFFGTNKNVPIKQTKFCVFVWRALDDLMLKILIIAAIVSFL